MGVAQDQRKKHHEQNHQPHAPQNFRAAQRWFTNAVTSHRKFTGVLRRSQITAIDSEHFRQAGLLELPDVVRRAELEIGERMKVLGLNYVYSPRETDSD